MSGARLIHLLVMPEYKPGDPAPEGYLQWHEWADVQAKAGLKQVECVRCGRWKFPQELSATVQRWEARDRRGKVVQQEGAVCLKCDKPKGA